MDSGRAVRGSRPRVLDRGRGSPGTGPAVGRRAVGIRIVQRPGPPTRRLGPHVRGLGPLVQKPGPLTRGLGPLTGRVGRHIARSPGRHLPRSPGRCLARRPARRHGGTGRGLGAEGIRDAGCTRATGNARAARGTSGTGATWAAQAARGTRRTGNRRLLQLEVAVHVAPVEPTRAVPRGNRVRRSGFRHVGPGPAPPLRLRGLPLVHALPTPDPRPDASAVTAVCPLRARVPTAGAAHPWIQPGSRAAAQRAGSAGGGRRR